MGANEGGVSQGLKIVLWNLLGNSSDLFISNGEVILPYYRGIRPLLGHIKGIELVS